MPPLRIPHPPLPPVPNPVCFIKEFVKIKVRLMLEKDSKNSYNKNIVVATPLIEVPIGDSFLCWHTHWDRAWYVSFEQYQHRLIAVLERIVHHLENGRLAKFSLDGQTALLHDAHALIPSLLKRLEPYFKSGRLHVGPWFTMPDTNLVSLESLLRNLEKGIGEANTLGCSQFTAYLPDTFGQPESIPMLFNKLGISHAMIWRGRALNPDASPLFHWLSLNGEGLISYQLPEGYFHMPLQDVEIPTLDAKIQAVKDLETRLAKWGAPAFLPFGGDHLAPPNASTLDACKHTLEGYTVVHPHEFMETVASKTSKNNLETRHGELRDYGENAPPLLSGTLLSRPWLKHLNAQCEWSLTQVWEPLRARHQEYLLTHQIKTHDWQWQAEAKALKEAWRLLLLNQPHDDICGCSIDSVHLQNEARFQSVLDLAQTWSNWHRRELESLLGQTAFLPIEIPLKPDAILSFQGREKPPSEQRLGKAVEESRLIDDWQQTITEVPLSHRVETMFSSYQQANGKAPDALVKLDAEKLMEAFLKRLSIESVEDKGDSYNASPVAQSHEIIPLDFLVDDQALDAQASLLVQKDKLTVSASYKGHGVIELEIVHEIHTQNQQVNLRLDAPSFARCHERDLHSGFSTTTLNAPKASDRFPTFPVDKTAGEWQAVSANYHGAVRWGAAIRQSLITAGHYAYEVVEDALILPLHRGFSHLSGGRLPTRFYPAGPPFETPAGQGIGRTITHRLRWMPHDLNEASLAFHRHQLLVRPVYQALPEIPIPSVIDTIVQQAPKLLRVTSHQWLEEEQCFALRLLNTSDDALRLVLPPSVLWCRKGWSHQKDFQAYSTVTIAPRDWVFLAYVIK